MRKIAFLAAVAVLAVAGPAAAQAGLPAVIPAASAWRDIPALVPELTDAETRARMNAEIVRAIQEADGDQAAARRAISAIVARYQEIASSQGARTRPAPK